MSKQTWNTVRVAQSTCSITDNPTLLFLSLECLILGPISHFHFLKINKRTWHQLLSTYFTKLKKSLKRFKQIENDF